jgi:hypothetical protein
MKGALDSSLSQASASIKAVASSLQDLPRQLSAAATETAQEHLRLTEAVQRGVDDLLRNTANQISSSIQRGTEDLVGNLQNTGSVLGASSDKIGHFLELFTARGDEYIQSLASISSQSSVLQDSLSNLCS